MNGRSQPTFDASIINGTVVDGTGAPRRRADVGIRDGRVVVVGDLDGAASANVIDATDRIVAPGFIDVHTHLDAQVFWDTTLSPSPLHGVTTAIAGNCGFSLQPLGADPSDRQYVMRMLSRVEGMPLRSLEVGVPWNWTTTAEYLDLLEARLSINVGFKVGHSALRRAVMGPDATRRECTEHELAVMKRLLGEGLEAGAIGFSSSWSTTHNDTEQNMVPSRYASRRELLALCSVLAAYPGTSIEFIPCVGPFGSDVAELMAEMSVAGSAPLNWNVLTVTGSNHEECLGKLRASDVAAERGGKVVGLTAPISLDFRMSFANGFVLDGVPGWERAMLLPHSDKVALLRDPVERARLGELAARDHPLRRSTDWAHLMIYHAVAPENARFVGRLVGDIAAELGKSPWDALVDIALTDDLATSFGRPQVDEPEAIWEARVQIWRDGRAVVGASDAGAHLDMFFSADYATRMLSEAVTRRGLLPLEEAIHLLTAVPADLYMLRDRGRLVEGAWADIVVFDEGQISSNPMAMRSDLPAGAARLYASANGIDRVLCNGVEIVRDGDFTEARPGSVIRSGRDTG